MKRRCPITYEYVSGDALYSKRGLSMLSPRLQQLHPLPYSAEQQRDEAASRAVKMSIQGVQPKLSARLNVEAGLFEFVDTGGTYILKPPHMLYPSLPENEALSMRLAETVEIDVPLHGLLYSTDGSFTYFVRRFDRFGRGKKRMQEDFAQLMGKTRNTKYEASIEQLIPVIDEHCTFPAIEKIKLFRRILFSFLMGNEDMHLKNYSLLVTDKKIELSPGYDLLNTTIAMRGTKEESAISLKGRKKNQTSADFFQYLAKERLSLMPAVIDDERNRFMQALKSWPDFIGESFLKPELKEAYQKLVQERQQRVGL